MTDTIPIALPAPLWSGTGWWWCHYPFYWANWHRKQWRHSHLNHLADISWGEWRVDRAAVLSIHACCRGVGNYCASACSAVWWAAIMWYNMYYVPIAIELERSIQKADCIFSRPKDSKSQGLYRIFLKGGQTPRISPWVCFNAGFLFSTYCWCSVPPLKCSTVPVSLALVHHPRVECPPWDIIHAWVPPTP